MDENKSNHEHGCGDDCGCEEEYQMMHLVLDDDTEVDCYVLGIFEVKNSEYIALVPEDSEDVLIYKYTETEEDGVQLDNIEDDDEYEEVGKTFDELFSDQFEDEEESDK